MASIVKIKRSSVQGKAPTTSDIQAGELALNTRDGKLFSSDGSKIFEVGANTSALTVGSITIGNTNPFTLPETDGFNGQVIKTDGNGNLTWQDQESADVGRGYRDSTTFDVPTGDLNGDDAFVGETVTVDAFGVLTSDGYTLMEPVGRIRVQDLGVL